jgi:activating signal cointegrator 1
MICLSLHQPYASALFAPADAGFHAIKLHETRSWKMPEHYINSWIGVHAAKRDDKTTCRNWDRIMGRRSEFWGAFERIGIGGYTALPRGCVIGKIMFGPSSPTDKFGDWWKDMAREWGDYAPGRWAWPVVQFQRFASPIPAIGRHGFFNVDLSAAIAA